MITSMSSPKQGTIVSSPKMIPTATWYTLTDSMRTSTSPTIQQGYLETSNVDIVSEMVEMIISYRAYEANAKAIQSQDSSLDHLFNKVAGSR